MYPVAPATTVVPLIVGVIVDDADDIIDSEKPSTISDERKNVDAVTSIKSIIILLFDREEVLIK
jgi:hypothetical protein